jgi:hypothetical protein
MEIFIAPVHKKSSYYKPWNVFLEDDASGLVQVGTYAHKSNAVRALEAVCDGSHRANLTPTGDGVEATVFLSNGREVPLGIYSRASDATRGIQRFLGRLSSIDEFGVLESPLS